MYMPNAEYRRFCLMINTLSISYGILLFLSGLDKLTDFSATEWFKFVSPAVSYGFPMSFSVLLIILSILQMIFGIMLVLPRYAKWGAYFSAGLLSIIALNLLSTGFHHPTAMLNVMLAISMLVLGQLIGIKNQMRDAAS